MLPDEVIAAWVEEDGKAPWVPEGDDMRFARVELDVQDLEQCNLLSCGPRLVYPTSEVGM